MPVIPIRLTGPKGSFDTAALIDSGADYLVMFKEHAEILGLETATTEDTECVGIGGKVKARLGRVLLQLKGEGEHKNFNFEVPAMILESHIENHPILIGRAEFFEKFAITFKEKDRRIYLKPEN